MKKVYIAIAVALLGVFLIGCNVDNESEEANDENESEENVVEEPEEDDDESDDSIESEDEIKEHMIDGTITQLEDDSIIRVEAETNLKPGLSFDIRINKAFGEVDASSITGMSQNNAGFETVEVQDDGMISIDYPMTDDFYDNYRGEFIEVEILSNPISNDELIDVYGEDGEEFTGPFVYQFNVGTDDELMQRLYTAVYMIVGDEQKEYPIEAKERSIEPEDYGDTDVWIEAEVVDTDDRFLYVEGESNILEGMMLSGRYYPDEETALNQGFRTETFIEPDGTFLLPVSYDSITSDGYIEVTGKPYSLNRTEEYLYEEYGEGFEDLSGDIVKVEDDQQEILLKIDREGLDLDIPEKSFATEEDGDVKVQLPDDVLFEFDESDLKNDAQETLDVVVDILEDVDEDTSIEINGHTDSEGEEDYNLELSEDRAGEVEDYINDNGDVDHLSIEMNGYGLTKPIASNDSEEGRKKNRRVEIIIGNE